MIEIFLGAQDVTLQYEPNRIGFVSSQYFVHPQFDPKTLNYDAGVIKLPVAINFNSQKSF